MLNWFNINFLFASREVAFLVIDIHACELSHVVCLARTVFFA